MLVESSNFPSSIFYPRIQLQTVEKNLCMCVYILEMEQVFLENVHVLHCNKILREVSLGR